MALIFLNNFAICLLLLNLSTFVASNSIKDLLMDKTTTTTTTMLPPTNSITTTTASSSAAYVVSAAAMPAYSAGKLSSGMGTLVPHPPPPPAAVAASAAVKTPMKYFNKSTPKKRKAEELPALPIDDPLLEWKCPNVTGTRSLECGCDLPHTLRCSGDLHGLTFLAERLRDSPYTISLLDCWLRNVSYLSDAKIFEGVSLHGLVISSGEIKRVHKSAFLGIKGKLQALGLPGNALLSVPWNSIASLTGLERLDLSNNRIKALGTADFVGLTNLVYLELSNNQISSISQRTFANLRKLEVLKLAGNRLGDYTLSLKSLSQCFNLRQLDLSANNLNGPLSAATLPSLRNLEALNLNRNMIKSIQNKAMMNFTRLASFSLQHNQIDVLQDHAFYGLGSLETLDLSYNGIVAISSASLQHLTRLTVLDLTHNFLRAFTSDLIAPLPSLRELRLAGNDISIVAKNALDGARELKSLSMQDNPLSCDCSIRHFAEWLQVAKLQSQDMISATCVTPPRLEGAPLVQVPVELLNCEMDNVEKDNANIIEHLETLSKPNQSTPIRDLSENFVLHELHYSADYGLILTWIINLSKDDYTCDAIFVYKEENINEILIDNSPIHCESKSINGQNTVSVIVPDSSSLQIGESYRFCLVLVQEQNPKADLNIGCSNITQLQLSSPSAVPIQAQQNKHRPYYGQHGVDDSRGSSLLNDEFAINKRQFTSGQQQQQQQQQQQHSQQESQHAQQATVLNHYDFIDSLNRSFLPGLGLGILVTSIVVLIWGATRIRHNVNNANSNHNNNNNSRPGTPTATTCYSASEHIARLADPDHGARYLKLQATTSL